MRENKTEYDLICSLGANCSVSSQLSSRQLRKISLPLDWTWFNSEKTLYKISEGFENNFADFMKQENLITLEGDDWSSSHVNRYQYEDKETGIKYYNHFYKIPNEKQEQRRVIKLFRKRCRRFDYLLKHSKKVLLILSFKKDIEIEPVKYLLEVIQKKYPNTEINIRYQGFCASENSIIKLPYLEIYKYQREENLYDYTATNWEWRWLDNISLSKRFHLNCLNFNLIEKDYFNIITNIINLHHIKKGISINLLRFLNTFFYFKLYILGIRLQFAIGKLKEE